MKMSRIIKKKQKQKPVTMVEPPPYDEPSESIGNRLHQRQNIINELDLIKARVDQIIQSFEDEVQTDVFSAASISIPVKTLDNLLKQHESTGATREKELSSARDFFKKCAHSAECLEEVVLATAEERANDQSTSRMEEFESAFHNTTEKIHQIKSLNAQMIGKLSDLLEQQKLRSQFIKGDPERQNLRHEEIINMYTNEAIKCNKLERTITTINDELHLLKSRNLYLTEKNEADESKLQVAEDSRKELEETIKRLRLEINTLKHRRKFSVKPDSKNNFVYNQSDNSNSVSPDVQEKLQPIVAKSEKSPTTTPTNNATGQPRADKKNVPSKASLQTKKQVATKYTSKLLDQQLNNMEELMIQGQQNVSITEKELSNLARMTDEALKQKYQEEYSCLCDSVQVVTLLLGFQGAEKLTAAVKLAAPGNFFAGHSDQPIKIYDLINNMKTAVSRVILEMKLFIKLKRKLMASSSKGDKTQKKVNEVQKWLDHELSGIHQEITQAVEQYETDKEKIEKFHITYFDQLSKKIESNAQKLSKTLEKLNLPDFSATKSMLESISTTVSELKQRPKTPFKQLVHKSPDLETAKESKVSVDTVAKNMEKINNYSMSTIDTIRKSVASHLKTMHGVNISSKSWRTKSYKKPRQTLTTTARAKDSNRKLLLPALASCVEFGVKADARHSSKASSGTTHLPTIQRPKTTEPIPKRSHCHTNFQNQKSVQILPTVMESAELTGRNLLSGKK